MEEMKYRMFLIDESLVDEVVMELKAFIDHVDGDCANSGCMCDMRGDLCSSNIRNVLHHFESGLYLYLG